jgi:hypothetical protein
MTAAFNLAQLANNLNTSGQLDATDGLNGIVPVANGGTGRSTITANNVILGNGTSAVGLVAPGTSGNALISNGTTWTSGGISKLSTASGTAPSFSVRAYVYFNGTLNTSGSVDTSNTARFLYASGNVTSVVRTGQGNYQVNFTTEMPRSDYLILPLQVNSAGNANFETALDNNNAQTTTYASVTVVQGAGRYDGQGGIAIMC